MARVESSGDGARLVSWPPQRYERRRQTWYYSACLTITVHTVPFAPRFRVHVSTQYVGGPPDWTYAPTSSAVRPSCSTLHCRGRKGRTGATG
ncbi:pPIWI_RE module domain-containing protein [Streptomyces albus]